jgi:hypothetical protein
VGVGRRYGSNQWLPGGELPLSQPAGQPTSLQCHRSL